MAYEPTYDLIVLSHLRWDFVFQRPQHLLTRFGKRTRVFFVEEPIQDGGELRLEISAREEGVWKVVPHGPAGCDPAEWIPWMKQELSGLIRERNLERYVLWYYTPMALPFTEDLSPIAVVYDCMDELSLFKGAPAGLIANEDLLFLRADVVFTGGMSLFEAKRSRHPNVHAFPSSIDRQHFHRARRLGRKEPADQAAIPGPRLGYFGVIDERMDLDLIDGVARRRPAWQFVMVGPVVKIGQDQLPRRSNIHYLGQKNYSELPDYISGWDVALMPFALNDSTRFISPTKTPEYLAAGKPVVSTPIRDVVEPYGAGRLVEIASGPDSFVAAIEASLATVKREFWLEQVDRFLDRRSWDRTWEGMLGELDSAILRKSERIAPVVVG